MSDDNKRIVIGLLEGIWNGGDPEEAIGRYRAPDCIAHGLDDAPLRGVEAYRGFLDLVRSVLQGTRFVVDDAIAEGDRVAVRGRLTGKTAAGRSVALRGVAVARIADGKIVEAWNGWDGLDLQGQLGGGPASIAGVLRAARLR
jgi:predicted ester cyclase